MESVIRMFSAVASKPWISCVPVMPATSAASVAQERRPSTHAPARYPATARPVAFPIPSRSPLAANSRPATATRTTACSTATGPAVRAGSASARSATRIAIPAIQTAGCAGCCDALSRNGAPSQTMHPIAISSDCRRSVAFSSSPTRMELPPPSAAPAGRNPSSPGPLPPSSLSRGISAGRWAQTALARLSGRGVHPPGGRPFLTPWTEGSGAEAENGVRYGGLP